MNIYAENCKKVPINQAVLMYFAAKSENWRELSNSGKMKINETVKR